MHVMLPTPLAPILAKTGIYTPYLSSPTSIEEAIKYASHVKQENELKGKKANIQAQSILQSSGIKATTTLQEGDAATEIINYAKERETDLIVIGSRGMGQVRGWILGSVSRKLVHYAGCSVLIVK